MDKAINDARLRKYLKRDRINQLLTPKDNNKLITLTAESGYGKTRAVLDYLSDKDAKVLWLPLTPSDNHPACFWKRLIDSMKLLNKDVAGMMEKIDFPSSALYWHHFLSKLIQEIHRSKEFIIVLDDFQNLKTPAILDLINGLLNLDLPDTYMYLLSREEITLRGPGTHPQNITAKDLTFTFEELETYFHKREIPLSYELLKDIHIKTEGWPFAVYLASLAANNNKNLLDHTFHFSNNLIFDTIDQELFSKHSPEEQRFVLRLSLLDYHPAQMIDDLFGHVLKNYYDGLGQNLLIRYSPHNNTYICHSMFRQFLEQRHYLLSEEEKNEMYQLAANWYYQHNMTVDAINCYRKAHDYDALWKILSDLVPGHFSVDFAETLIETINVFPETFKDKYPLTRVIHGALCSLTINIEEGFKISQAIIQSPDSSSDTIGDAYINLAFYHMQNGDTAFVQCFKAADHHLTDGSNLYRAPFLFLLNGDPISLKKGEAGELNKWVSALEEAEPYYTRVLHGNLSGLAILARAMALYYQGEMQRAEEAAVQAIYQGKEHQQTDIVCCAYFLIVRLAAFKGDYQLVTQSLIDIRRYTDTHQTPTQFNLPDLAYGAFYAKIELNQFVPDWIITDKLYTADTHPLITGLDSLIRANCMLNSGNFSEVVAYLQQTEKNFLATNKYIYLIHLYVILAIASYNVQNTDDAVRYLHKSFTMSHKNNILMVFATYGKYARSLLTAVKRLKAAKKLHLTDSNKQLLSQIPAQWLDLVITKATTFAKRISTIRELYINEHIELQNDPEPLTKREKDILIAICEGMTRDEIADNLNISINTVKSMLASIYSKLGAVNNAHAVRIAMLRGII